MAAFNALRLAETFQGTPIPPVRSKIRLVRHGRDTGVSESEIFSLLHAKEQECCDRATD
jgi:hypothetical protein